MSIGRQIVETLRTHEKVGKAEARDRALAMLEAVQIRDPQRVFDLYPHEVSGGMGQRAMIAMMLIAGPELLIADEPTSALDVTVQLDMLAHPRPAGRRARHGADLHLARSAAGLVLLRPRHRHVCRQDRRGTAGGRTRASRASLYARPAQLHAEDRRRTGIRCRCSTASRSGRCDAGARHRPASRSSTTVIRALKGVSLEVAQGESFGLVGESGSGKSTLLRAIAGLAPVTGGHDHRRRQEARAAAATRPSTARSRWCSRTPTARCIRARRSTGCCSSRWPSTASRTSSRASSARSTRSASARASASAIRTSFPAASASAWRSPAR